MTAERIGEITTSVARIARLSNVSEQEARDALARLAELGIVGAELHRGGDATVWLLPPDEGEGEGWPV
jgi:hypothetical protein